MKKNVLAIDLGASSGKAFLGGFDGENITLKEVHRFENTPIEKNKTLYWDLSSLFSEIKQAIINAKQHGDFQSIGIDTWGVDFGLISKDGTLLDNPVHYRDKRTSGMIEKLSRLLGGESSLYNKTGIQIMEINTIFQLYSLTQNQPELLSKADKLLLMPDLLNYMLTGEKHAEISIVSTTQLLEPYTHRWNTALINKLGLPEKIFPPLVSSGSIAGTLKKELCKELDIEAKPLINTASHDTASAVVGIPTSEKDFLFISCGTWGLLGTVLDSPVITEKSKAYNLTNEVGYNNKIRLLKNIAGLWLIQELRREYLREGKTYTYSEMEEIARNSSTITGFIDPDAPEFFMPGAIKAKINDYCIKTNQTPPQNDGEIIRCIYESLAMKYNYAFNQIKECTGKSYDKIYMVGGGINAKLLCQLTSNATGRTVLAGATDATAFGNVIVQLIANNIIPNISKAYEILEKSDSFTRYVPQEQEKTSRKNLEFKTHCR